MTKEQEQLKTVAEYDGLKYDRREVYAGAGEEDAFLMYANHYTNCGFDEFTGNPIRATFGSWVPVSRMEYHYNWAWQIPVWSKALKELEELRVKYKQSKLGEDYRNFIIIQEACTIFPDVYYQSVDRNSPSDGFEVLNELIQFIKEYKQ